MRTASRMRPSQGGLAFLVAMLLAFWFSGLPAAHGQKPPKKRQVKVIKPAPESAPRIGSYYALIIGIKNYKNFTPLETPLNDANEVAAILRDQYRFKAQVLLDATRDQILDALGRYRGELHEDDNLLIYYAGHGNYDKPSDLAYWYPVEAGQTSPARWINATEITGQARAIPARHVLVIADSCYSGMFVRGAEPTIDVPQTRDEYLKKLVERKSRHVMASGGNEPVADKDTAGHPTNHSVFANALLQGLREFRQDRYSAEELFDQYIREQVAGRSKQLPEYDAIRDSDHNGGGFVFVRSRGIAAPPIRDVVVPARQVELITTPVEPPRHRTDPEAEAVLAALHQYEDAYASMDIDMLKAIWPSLSKAQVAGLKAGFRGAQAVKVQVQKCDLPTTNGDTAQIRCEQSMVYTREGKRQPETIDPVEISLRRAPSGGWVVAEVRSH